MARYIVRRLLTMLLTMILVSMLVFAIVEIAPGNVARNILGAYATPEQEASMSRQLGLTRPVTIRYISWLFGSDWQAKMEVGLPMAQTISEQGLVKNAREWWAVAPNGEYLRWTVEDGKLYKLVVLADGKTDKILDEEAWIVGGDGSEYFWGVDTANRAAKWVKGSKGVEYRLDYSGWVESTGAPVEYIPLSKGLIRGDAGVSLRYQAPVAEVIGRRILNSFILAALAIAVSIPTAVILGLLAGLNEGKLVDRIISIGGLITAGSPDFATGILLIMVFAIWLKVLPGAAVFTSADALWKTPNLLVLPVLTASLVEIGYVLRITRSSVVEVMNSPYVRTAILKGLTYRQVVTRHVLRNAMMAPITVIMLHVNWFIGGLVVVESVFGYPGLGNFILNAALFKDVYSIEAGAMVLILLAVGTQLIADLIYSLVNPRIRYS
jgi:peptide/nickel transport system permease protein